MKNKTQPEQIEFLKSLIDKFVLCTLTVGGDAVMTREEFDRDNSHPDAPGEDYTYDEYLMDCIKP